MGMLPLSEKAELVIFKEVLHAKDDKMNTARTAKVGSVRMEFFYKFMKKSHTYFIV
jgi:hypothetical protein